eukprot:2928895-Pyramimonas_sp.AAC.1
MAAATIPTHSMASYTDTRAPRDRGGAISAVYVGTTTALMPMPNPTSKRPTISPTVTPARTNQRGITNQIAVDGSDSTSRER